MGYPYFLSWDYYYNLYTHWYCYYGEPHHHLSDPTTLLLLPLIRAWLLHPPFF